MHVYNEPYTKPTYWTCWLKHVGIVRVAAASSLIMCSDVVVVMIKVPRKYYERTTNVLRKYHESTTKVPRTYYENTTKVPR